MSLLLSPHHGPHPFFSLPFLRSLPSFTPFISPFSHPPNNRKHIVPPSMADPASYSKPHFPLKELHSSKPLTKTSKSSSSSSSFTSHVLCKSLFFVLFLVLTPLFPSQAPEFISQSTIFTKFWDLAHLLFIGLAVCYGLFSRRNVEDFDFEPPPHYSDDSQSSYVSRIFHVSPIFEDGSENLTGFDDKNVYQNWNSQYYRGEAMVYDANGHELNKTGTHYSRGEYTVDGTNGNERNKDGSLDAENGFENSFENADSNVVQTWNSQYFQGESTVIVSQPNYSLGEYGNLGQAKGYRPLGLPVRSLNPRARNLDSSQYSNGSESGTGLSGSGSGSGSGTADDSGRSVKENDFGDMDPTNLEGMFDETVPSQTPWRSRFETNEIRETVGSSAGGYSHFRPLSVDETQFEPLKSQSFRSTPSLSSQGNPPQHHGPSHFRSLPVDETQFESLKSQFFRSTASLSQGNPAPQHAGPSHFRPLSVDETQFESLKSQSFRSTTSMSSQGSSASYSPTTLSPSRSVSSEMPNSETEELGENKSYRASYPPTSQSPATRKADAPLNAFHLRRYSSGSLFQKDSQRSSKDDLKDLKGKRNEDTMGSRKAGQGSLRSDQKPATPVKISSLKGKSVRTIRASRYAAETLKAGEMSRNHIVDNVGKICDEAQTNSDNTRHPMSKPTLSKYKMKENEIFSESVAVESTDDSESENDISRVKSDEDSAPATNNDAGDYSSEVDKKAGEFIAKFREQIRLQKVASIGRSKGKRMNGS
ncbi:dentin sialophosphoprotein [Salix suchowensis]|nr:dentin sialophosphoprotein [Salix suchowensis]